MTVTSVTCQTLICQKMRGIYKKYASHANYFNFLTCSSSSERVINPFEVKHILLQHQKRVLYDVDEEGYQRINIRRSCLLEDTFRQFSKHSFNVKKLIRVTFIGEPAVDDGGDRGASFSVS